MNNENNDLTPIEKLGRILRWQNSPITHPLTCGGENCEDVSMVPTLSLRYDVELVCPQCKRVQYFIPHCCYSMSIEEFDNHENKLKDLTKDENE